MNLFWSFSGIPKCETTWSMNKIDLEDSGDKLELLRRELREADLEVIPVSGRTGINLANMLVRIKSLHEQFRSKQ